MRSSSYVLAAAAVALIAAIYLTASEKASNKTPENAQRSVGVSASNSRSDEALKNSFTSSLPSLRRSATEISVPSVHEDATVAETYTKLRTAALAGATNPACRIAVGLQKCHEAKLNLATAANLAQQGRDAASREAASGLLRSYEQSSQTCEGVSDAMIAEAYRFQAIAASSGEKSMERWLAVKPALDPSRFLQDIDQWRDYQRRAKDYFAKALAKKSGGDLGVLLLVYAPADAPLPRPPYKSPDPATFLALYEIAMQSGVPIPNSLNTAATELRESLSPQQATEVQERRLELGAGWEVNTPREAPFRSLVPPGASICR